MSIILYNNPKKRLRCDYFFAMFLPFLSVKFGFVVNFTPIGSIKLTYLPTFTIRTSQIYRWIYHTWVSTQKQGWAPQIIHFNRVFHYFHHPFWGVFPLYLETPTWIRHGFYINKTNNPLAPHLLVHLFQVFLHLDLGGGGTWGGGVVGWPAMIIHSGKLT